MGEGLGVRMILLCAGHRACASEGCGLGSQAPETLLSNASRRWCGFERHAKQAGPTWLPTCFHVPFLKQLDV